MLIRRDEWSINNFSDAFAYYERAAQNNNRYAYFNLAEMYTYGLGVEQNFDEADRYYQLAINAVWMNREAAKEYKAYLASR